MTEKISRLSGIALIIGSAILIYKAYFFPELLEVSQVEGYLNTLNATSLILIVGLLLLLLGFTGAYGKIAKHAGIPGLIGFIFLYIYFIIYEMTTSTLTTSIAPVVFDGVITQAAFMEGEQFMVNVFDQSIFKYFLIFIPMVFFGSLLFGIGTLKSKVLPKWLAYLMFVTMIVPLLGFVPIPFLQLLFNSGFFYITLLCFGFVLSFQKGTTLVKSETPISTNE